MGALDVSKGTVKSIYALGAKLGMVERGNGHEDALHALVQGLTGKESITALTPAEAQAVLAELRRRSAPATAPQKKWARKYEALPGGLSEGQQKKVWYLMFQLEKFDPAPEGVQLRDRLCGLISRQFGVTAFPIQSKEDTQAAVGELKAEFFSALGTEHPDLYRQLVAALERRQKGAQRG